MKFLEPTDVNSARERWTNSDALDVLDWPDLDISARIHHKLSAQLEPFLYCSLHHNEDIKIWVSV